MESLLKIENLCASVNDMQILKGINLDIKEGEVHAIMGLNGSGKSTLSNVIAGNPAYSVTGGKITYKGEDLLSFDVSQRALKGIFLSFQNPVELGGVSLNYFLRTCVNNKRKENNEKEYGVRDFQKMLIEKSGKLNFPQKILSRSVNEGFSGGEKKRCETLQLRLLKPDFAILDEIDSGLDIDALNDVSNAINEYRKENPKASFLIITHYKRLLDYIKPDVIHVLIDGKIKMSSDFSLAEKLETEGYAWIE